MDRGNRMETKKKKSTDKSSKNILKRMPDALAALFLCISFICVCYYIFYIFRDEITSDCTDTILWAQAMVTSGKIFSPTFRYAGFIPFGGQTIMYLFVKVLGVTMKAQMLSMFTFAVLFLVAVYFAAYSLLGSYRYAGFTTGVMLATLCVSVKLREIFFGHIIYYSLGVLFYAVTLIIIAGIIKAPKDKPDKVKTGKGEVILYAVLGIFMFLTATDGLLSIVQCMLPLFGAVVMIWCFNTDKKMISDKKLYMLAAVMLVSSGIGFIAGGKMHGDMVAGYAEAYSAFDGAADWTDNLMKLIPQWYQLLGVTAASGLKFMSAEGLYNLILIAYATFIFVIPVIMLVRIRKIDNIMVKILVISHWIMTAVIMAGYVFGRLSGGNWRLSPLLCSAILICAAYVKMCISDRKTVRFGYLAMAVVVFINLLISAKVMSIDAEAYKENIYYQLADELESRGLEYGYATFWNANVITLISDSKVTVRSIDISSDSKISKGYYQSESYWFDDQPGVQKYFMLLTKREFTDVAQNDSESIGGYDDYFSFDNYYILIYDDNPMNR